MSRYAELRQEWTDIIEQWSISGLSGAEFCRRRELSAARFYTWRRRLGRTATRSDGAFVPLSFSDQDKGCGIAVVADGVRLELSAGFNERELVRALRALGAC